MAGFNDIEEGALREELDMGQEKGRYQRHGPLSVMSTWP